MKANSARTGITKRKSSGGVVDTIKTVVYAVLIALVVRTVAVEPFNIPSGSMVPTLLIGDYLFVSKFSYGYSRYSLPLGLPLFSGRIFFHSPERGDVTVFKLPTDNSTDYIKRVIGLPGEVISLQDGSVSINGRLLPEPFLPTDLRTDTYPGPSNNGFALHHAYRIPAGDVFVMGDNRPESCDSRYWGPIRESTIVGEVDLRIWPLSRIGFF